MRQYFLKLLLSVLALLKPKRKLTWKRFVLGTVTWTVAVTIIIAAHMFSYYRGRVDERAYWEPRWQIESTEYRMMPYGIDD